MFFIEAVMKRESSIKFASLKANSNDTVQWRSYKFFKGGFCYFSSFFFFFGLDLKRLTISSVNFAKIGDGFDPENPTPPLAMFLMLYSGEARNFEEWCNYFCLKKFRRGG